MRAAAALAMLAVAPDARADECRAIEVDFVPGALAAREPMTTSLQIVAWLEDAQGNFVDTVYITEETGTYGLGNRPGRFDFNSGPMWPYGRRTTVFPVWAHRHGLEFAELDFQDGYDSNLSHESRLSSRELHYCLPLLRDQSEWAIADAGTCASVDVYTDKGVFSSRKSLYPPRADLVVDVGRDALDVPRFAETNPFDAVSQATPTMGVAAQFRRAIPAVPPGDYVLFVETSREFDHNATYTTSAYPPPAVSFGEHGKPYRGQPSIVYRVPITVAAATTTTGSTATYAGYGAPDGADGALRPPDATITTDVPGSGAQRFLLAPGGYRVRATVRGEPDVAAPAAPGELELSDVTDRSATIRFVAPGDDGLTGRAEAYEIRLGIGADVTEDTFDKAVRIVMRPRPVDPGAVQTITLPNLLFDTDYSLAIRAVDDCLNPSPIRTVRFRTLERAQGEVDWCFIATAAYGSAMAADVEALRGFRDRVLRSSVLGELAVEAYYTLGPAVSGAIGESELLRATARAVLAPIVALAREVW